MSIALPDEWTMARLGDLVEVNPKARPDALAESTPVSFVPMAAVEERTGRADVSATRVWGAVRKGYTPMRDGDVLFAKITPCMENGKVALVDGMTNGVGAGSTEFVVLRSSTALDRRYLLHFLLQERVRRDARAVMQGAAGQLRVPTSFLGSLPVPVPPLAEQRRIVAALEEHLSDLDAAVARLERARANLRRYADAVREQALADHAEVPLAQLLAEPLGNGRSVPTAAGGFPVLRLTALRDGHVDLTEAKPGAWTAADARPFLVAEHDFLIARGNGSKHLVGRGGLVGPVAEPVAYPDTVIRARLDPTRVLPTFMRVAWDGRRVRAQIEETARTTAGIYKVNQAGLERVLVPVPSLDTQREIVAEVDRRLTIADRTAAELDVQLARAARLRQAVLARAFAGRLVPQDPADEPAAALLARIGAERAATPARAGRRARASRP